MVETAISSLVNDIKPLFLIWGPNDQEKIIDMCIDAWCTNNFGEDELTQLETELEKSLKTDGKFDEKI